MRPRSRNWLQGISQHTAEAAKEGGFLGFGGVQVSDAEKATLGEISSALKMTAAAARIGCSGWPADRAGDA